eukprot:4062691-Amphidinium_carterae.2
MCLPQQRHYSDGLVPKTTGRTTTSEALDEVRERTTMRLSWTTNRVLQRSHCAQHDEGLLPLTTLFVQHQGENE